eukprot:914870-Pelagomonas_calceolata.AAC.2
MPLPLHLGQPCWLGPLDRPASPAASTQWPETVCSCPFTLAPGMVVALRSEFPPSRANCVSIQTNDIKE